MNVIDLGKRPFKAGVILFFALVIAFLSILVSMTNVTRGKDPDLALRFISFDSEALALSAEKRLGNGSNKRDAAIAKSRAISAIRRDATLAVAMRVYGMSAIVLGDVFRGNAAMQHANLLSRRDFKARLWLIENAVGEGNLGAALYHFDVALRTSPFAPDILFPILDNAIDDPEIAPAVTSLFKANPPWLRSFVEFVITKGNGKSALGSIVSNLPKDLPQIDQSLRLSLVRSLIDSDNPRDGYRLFVASTGAKSEVPSGVRSTNFRDIGKWPPFDWEFVDEVSIGSAARGDDQGDSSGGIDFHAQPGVGGRVAWQLLFLKPGKYLLRSTGTRKVDDEQSMAVWEIRCNRSGGPGMAALEMRVRGEEERTMQIIFTVPSEGCDHQWFTLNLRASQGQDELQGTVRSVRIDYLGR